MIENFQLIIIMCNIVELLLAFFLLYILKLYCLWRIVQSDHKRTPQFSQRLIISLFSESRIQGEVRFKPRICCSFKIWLWTFLCLLPFILRTNFRMSSKSRGLIISTTSSRSTSVFQGFVSVRIWFPKLPGVIMMSDQEVILMWPDLGIFSLKIQYKSYQIWRQNPQIWSLPIKMKTNHFEPH